MTRHTRRRLLTALGAAGTAALAGCGGDGGTESTDTESTASGATETDGGMETAGETSDGMGGETSSATYDYTFADGDAVVGSSLNGVRIDYPSGSGALSNVSLGDVLLGGGSLARDIQGTSTSNSADTYTISFSGSETITAGDRLSVDLSNIRAPSGSYEVTVTVNPQSGGTSFTESF